MAGASQSNFLGPIFNQLYTCDLPQTQSCTIATFADHTAPLATGFNIEGTNSKLQEVTDTVQMDLTMA